VGTLVLSEDRARVGVGFWLTWAGVVWVGRVTARVGLDVVSTLEDEHTIGKHINGDKAVPTKTIPAKSIINIKPISGRESDIRVLGIIH